ncbi:hypothetical protein ABGB14_49010 [Nonomuraea sp. B10E15]|uniref:YHS domain-containing protein n=1 Tax=Nonomuraea sp. B10E15 TaxID=3153560 RepID=UPI00325CEAD7
MLFVELLVPKGVFDAQERRSLAGRLTGRRLLSAVDGEPVSADPGVHVISLPEGGYGLHGRAQRSSDVLQLIERAKIGPAAPVPDDSIVDPVCGATVPLQDAVILERGGKTYGFCCPHCRGHFVKQLSDAEASS